MKKTSFLILILWVVSLISCSNESAQQTTVPEQGTYNVYLEIKKYEEKKLEIFTQKASYSGDTTFVYNFKVHFIDKDTISGVMTGDSGVVIEKLGYMEARENVKLVSSDGDSLLASMLIFNENENIIYSPFESILFKGGKVIRSTGLESDPGLKEITFRGKVYVD
ncbi:MAG TPA: LPS export ABC transporter periplasmic protein LptC [Candidatus Hydrothermia bacterium]|nr:LPS export ABC transporter periplasmic protein LptC [Candidatus Hydrothermae bacterium]MDD3649845.1 LPS export ABC transporter periplasmic protein LptC [Candidatus Hydrothermia bacterium]HOK22783.1 LPS export ABC transporter periplasmic protein LptC [Candidatus Hydrothermia bacterium]HOL23492.1 LPS export ABC transporter periplasmic protein LptC [Candidatus Hydrothermia bacterium]HOP32225.1 LPS export ABC transporter periplasmic protein LptC [Candidatus Hydrothermia bacterium]